MFSALAKLPVCRIEHQYVAVLRPVQIKKSYNILLIFIFRVFGDLDAEDVNVAFVEEVVVDVHGVDGSLTLLLVPEDLRKKVFLVAETKNISAQRLSDTVNNPPHPPKGVRAVF
jgi:hypothetical protein